MNGLELITDKQVSFGSYFGSTHPFFNVNVHTITNTWLILGIIFLIALPTRFIMNRKKGALRFILISFVNFFLDLYNQAFNTFSITHFSFVTTIFIFIMLCNTISVAPFTHEPTTDLNTTLALGIIAFIYTQIATIQSNGFIAYIKDYFSPFFVMMPLNVVGKLASVISISFRLFGNIFGGAIISTLATKAIAGTWWLELLGIFSGLNLTISLFFSLFEGCLQAFVFTMLTLTYLSLAVQGEGH